MTVTSHDAWTRRKVLASTIGATALATTPATAGTFNDLFGGKGTQETAQEAVQRTLTTKLGATTYIQCL